MEISIRNYMAICGALRFYGSADNWKQRPMGSELVSAVELDNGRIAAAALGEVRATIPPEVLSSVAVLTEAERAEVFERLGRAFGGRVLEAIGRAILDGEGHE